MLMFKELFQEIQSKHRFDRLCLARAINIKIQMYNKSTEKKPLVAQKPPLRASKPQQKEVENSLPLIKQVNKASTNSMKRITSAQNNSKTQKSMGVVNSQSIKKGVVSKRPFSNDKPSKTMSKVKQSEPVRPNWSRLPLNLLLWVAQYYCVVPFDVYRLSLVCSTWRNLMQCQSAIYFWKRFTKTSEATSFQQYKRCLIRSLIELKQKRSLQFESLYTKLFNYGSTKQNIPNKLISKLKLQLEVVINGKKYSQYPFKLRTFNFSSYLYSKITELNQIKFDMYTPHNMFKDNLNITITFYSRTYKVAHQVHYKLLPEDICDCAIKQKAFNYFLDKNLIITFFEGDTTFLYSFLEISLLELITEFRKIIKRDFQEHIDKKNKKLPMYKKLCQTQFQDFVQYIKYQADFQLHMSYHNSVQQIFTHCDTKVYPLDYSQKMAYFDVKIDDTFQKTSTFMLDNKMGMSERIEDLYLLDFVLKDRDRFIIVFSGFIYARKASQKERQSIDNYFEFNELPIKVLEFKCKKYEFSITIIEEIKKNLIKNTKFSIYP